MNCPDTGTLRALLDDEAPAEVASHVADCAECDAELADLRDHERFSAGAVALLAAPAAQTSEVLTSPVVDSNVRPLRRRRAAPLYRRLATAVAIVGVAALVVGTPAGRQATADLLARFRSERVTVVTVDPYVGSESMSVLQSLGEVTNADALGQITPVASVAEAERRVGFDIQLPDPAVLPPAFRNEPQVLVSDATEVRLKFDEEMVRSWPGWQKDPDPTIPEGLGDTTLVVNLPAAAVLSFQASEWEMLLIGQSELVTAHTEGALGLDQVRDFLLNLPGLPPDTVRQLRAIDDWRNTLPLPVPADQVSWRDTTLAGAPAVSLKTTDGLGSAILWQSEGMVHGVGGLISQDEARRVAEGLR